MKRGFFIVLFAIFYSSVALTQVIPEDESRSFLIYNSGRVLYGQVIDFNKGLFSNPHFMVDSKRYPVSEVRFFKNELGFFANVNNTKGTHFKTPKFVQRVRKGKINLYERVYHTGYMYGLNRPTRLNTYSVASTPRMGLSTSTIHNYYNKGYGPVKRATLSNLETDLADNLESLKYLAKAKRTRNIQTILAVSGGVALVTGIVTAIGSDFGRKNEMRDKPSNEPPTGSIVAIGFGAVSFWTCYFLGFSKPKNLRKAIDAYNYQPQP